MPWQQGERDLHNSSKNHLQRIVIFFIATMALDSAEGGKQISITSNKKTSILLRERTQAQFSNSPIL